jgi:hypothetical protein
MPQQLSRSSMFFILFVLLGSLLAVTTPISANAADSYSEEVTIEVICPDTEMGCPDYVEPPTPPACEGMEAFPVWGPSVDPASANSIWFPGDPGAVYMELGFEAGLDEDCMPINPTGIVVSSFDIADESWGESSECSGGGCAADSLIAMNIGGFFTVPTAAELARAGMFSATFAVTWTP